MLTVKRERVCVRLCVHVFEGTHLKPNSDSPLQYSHRRSENHSLQSLNIISYHFKLYIGSSPVLVT